jgi:glycosyltransferase involved in cell wall biosynthesis
MTASSLQLSVVICTHNPRKDFLSRTVEGLCRQTLPSNRWEFLVIDNASTEPIGNRFAASCQPRPRVIREEVLGLTSARLRGIRESTAGLIVFVDDDNVLCPDYLQKACVIHERLPMLGVIGAAVILPDYEEQPQEDLLPHVSMLALRNEAEPSWSNDPLNGRFPWGAGMIVSREVAMQVAADVETNPNKRLLGRKGGVLNSCEDDEFTWAACAMGMGHGIFPELKITHLISRGRVQRDYLLRIKEGHEYSRTMLWFFHGRQREFPDPPATIADLLKSVLLLRGREFLRKAIRYGRQSSASKTTKAFLEAGRRGCERAVRDIRMLSDDRTPNRQQG